MVLSLKADVETALAPDRLMAFEICVIEALTNCVEHASGPDDAAIGLALEITDLAVTIEITDPLGAPPFDLRENSVDLADVDPMSESGRGLGLIQQFADAIDYGSVSGQNRLALTFFRNQPD